MAKIGFAIIFFLIIGKTYSQQQNYLVLIDADNDQAFRVRIGDTIYNSSTVGHLAIPHLKDSVYSLAIGFPKKQFQEHIFSVRVNKKDQGFQLKNLGEKGWALYNWQTRELKMPLPDSNFQKVPERGVKKDDAFSRLMAAVVNDTSVMYNAFMPQKALKDTVKNDMKQTSIKVDSTVTAIEKDKAPLVTPVTAIEDPSKAKPAKSKYPYIRKLSERSTSTAKRITYIDAVQLGSADTITIFIPLESKAANDSTKKIVPGKGKKKTVKETNNSADSAGRSAARLSKKPKNRPANSDCKILAIDHDVDTLSSNILKQNTIESKIEAANKYFKKKCFSVKQLKILGELFASDKSRYSFFEVARPYISDRENIGQLQSMFNDAEYIKKFNSEMTN